MCIKLSFENKIYLNRIKSKLSRTLDNVNSSFVNAVEEFDKKYTEIGGIIINKFNEIWYSNDRYRYRYNRAPSSYMSPTNSSSRISPFEVINSEESDKTTNMQSDVETNHVVINVNEEVESTLSKAQQQSKLQQKDKELVEKHLIDDTESFLDDAWDIINE